MIIDVHTVALAAFRHMLTSSKTASTWLSLDDDEFLAISEMLYIEATELHADDRDNWFLSNFIERHGDTNVSHFIGAVASSYDCWDEVDLMGEDLPCEELRLMGSILMALAWI